VGLDVGLVVGLDVGLVVGLDVGFAVWYPSTRLAVGALDGLVVGF